MTSLIERAKRQRLLFGFVAGLLVALIGFGVMATNGWLPNTDPLSGRKTGWFGTVLPGNAPNTWNPFTAPPSSPTPTPQLSKEYVHAGSRLVAVVDANASEVPPTDLGIWRPSTGVWWIVGSAGQVTYTWGVNGDKPVPGDFDGDGKTDFSVYRPSTGYWYVTRSSDSTTYSVYFGASTDIPAPADFDGDGKTDLALWRPSTYVWYIIPSSTGTAYYPNFGAASDIPAPADYDGDGRADLGVWRPSNKTFYSINSSNGASPYYAVGANTTDTPVSADYDGDGKADYATFSTAAAWTIRKSSTGTTDSPVTYGQSGDIPVQNDYDGDAKVDLAIWRGSASGMWNIKKSTNGQTRTEYWGAAGDIPVPSYYRR